MDLHDRMAIGTTLLLLCDGFKMMKPELLVIRNMLSIWIETGDWPDMERSMKAISKDAESARQMIAAVVAARNAKEN